MSSAEKTEKPTPQRLRKESRKGKSFNSRDLMAAVMLLTGVLVLGLATSLKPVMSLYRQVMPGPSRVSPMVAVQGLLEAFAWAVLPLLASCIVVIVLVSLLMSKGIIASESARFDLNRLNPINGFKNLFSMKVVKDLLRTLLYLLMTALFAWLAWHLWAAHLFAQRYAHDGQLIAVWLRMGLATGLGLLLALAPVYLLAGWLDHFLYIRELKMEKREVRREQKENEIKPEVRRRRQEIGEELSAQVQADTAGSTLILANPTHIAIGIFLPDDETPMPFVSVKEKGRRARQVIALAEHMGVPVVRDIRLARAIHANSQRYRFLDDQHIDGVMAVLRWLRDVERAAAPPPPPEPDPARGEDATSPH